MLYEVITPTHQLEHIANQLLALAARFVITSYSIHYTKLYEDSDRNSELPHSVWQPALSREATSGARSAVGVSSSLLWIRSPSAPLWPAWEREAVNTSSYSRCRAPTQNRGHGRCLGWRGHSSDIAAFRFSGVRDRFRSTSGHRIGRVRNNFV